MNAEKGTTQRREEIMFELGRLTTEISVTTGFAELTELHRQYGKLLEELETYYND